MLFFPCQTVGRKREEMRVFLFYATVTDDHQIVLCISAHIELYNQSPVYYDKKKNFQ
jgi:hypothetical protein